MKLNANPTFPLLHNLTLLFNYSKYWFHVFYTRSRYYPFYAHHMPAKHFTLPISTIHKYRLNPMRSTKQETSDSVHKTASQVSKRAFPHIESNQCVEFLLHRLKSHSQHWVTWSNSMRFLGALIFTTHNTLSNISPSHLFSDLVTFFVCS